jgi:hypothetical protein
MGWARVKAGLRVLSVSKHERKLNEDEGASQAGSDCYVKGLIQPTFDPS